MQNKILGTVALTLLSLEVRIIWKSCLMGRCFRGFPDAPRRPQWARSVLYKGNPIYFLGGRGPAHTLENSLPFIGEIAFVKTYTSANTLCLLTVLPNCLTICGAQNVSPYVHRSLCHLQIEEHVMKENRDGEVTCYCNMFTWLREID
jgi:hypothetical protein